MTKKQRKMKSKKKNNCGNDYTSQEYIKYAEISNKKFRLALTMRGHPFSGAELRSLSDPAKSYSRILTLHITPK